MKTNETKRIQAQQTFSSEKNREALSVQNEHCTKPLRPTTHIS